MLSILFKKTGRSHRGDFHGPPSLCAALLPMLSGFFRTVVKEFVTVRWCSPVFIRVRRCSAEFVYVRQRPYVFVSFRCSRHLPLRSHDGGTVVSRRITALLQHSCIYIYLLTPFTPCPRDDPLDSHQKGEIWSR